MPEHLGSLHEFARGGTPRLSMHASLTTASPGSFLSSRAARGTRRFLRPLFSFLLFSLFPLYFVTTQIGRTTLNRTKLLKCQQNEKSLQSFSTQLENEMMQRSHFQFSE